MRLKAMILIASGAAVSVGLLVVRQQRLQAVYEMTRSLERGGVHDRDLWMLRGQIAESIRPEHVIRMAAGLGPMMPIPREVCHTPLRLIPKDKQEEPLTRAER